MISLRGRRFILVLFPLLVAPAVQAGDSFLSMLQYGRESPRFDRADQGVYTWTGEHLYQKKFGILTTHGSLPEVSYLGDATRIDNNESFGLGKCERTLLSVNQEFPLAMMSDRSVINSVFKSELSEIAETLSANQVLFIEQLKEVPGMEAWKDRSKDLPPFIRPKVAFPQFKEVYERYLKQFLPKFSSAEEAHRASEHLQIQASIWLVSGQPLGTHALLPIEKAHNAFPIDRAKYPAVWEIGRAAQSDGGSLDLVATAAISQAYAEALSLGRTAENSYIVVHTVTPAHERLYRTHYGLETIQSSKDGKEKVQIASIATIAKFLAQRKAPIDFPKIERKIRNLLRFDPEYALKSGETLNLRFHGRSFGGYPVNFPFDRDEVIAWRAMSSEIDPVGFQSRDSVNPIRVHAFATREILYDFHELFYRLNAVELRGIGDHPTENILKHGLAIAWLETADRLSKMGISDPVQYAKEQKLFFSFREVFRGSRPDAALLVQEPRTYFKGTAGFSVAPELSSYDMDYRLKKGAEVDWQSFHIWRAEDVVDWLDKNPQWLQKAKTESDAARGALTRVRRSLRLLAD